MARLISERNYLGARLYLKQAALDEQDRDELLGELAAAIVEELSRTRRDDRERIAYLRGLLAWVLREVPGLAGLYREQVHLAHGSSDLLSQVSRGLRSIGDVASGRKTLSEGFSEAADEARRGVEEAARDIESGDAADRLGEFLTGAERGIRQGLEQLGEFFRELNEAGPAKTASGPADRDEAARDEAARSAARADRERDVEDADFEDERRDP